MGEDTPRVERTACCNQCKPMRSRCDRCKLKSRGSGPSSVLSGTNPKLSDDEWEDRNRKRDSEDDGSKVLTTIYQNEGPGWSYIIPKVQNA